MLKNKKILYNEDIMKNSIKKILDAKDLKEKKDKYSAEFELAKKQALICENTIKKIEARRTEYLEKMSQLQGAYKSIEDLEKIIGVKDLSAKSKGELTKK